MRTHWINPSPNETLSALFVNLSTPFLLKTSGYIPVLNCVILVTHVDDFSLSDLVKETEDWHEKQKIF